MSGDPVDIWPKDWIEVGAALPPDVLNERDDDGTMPENVETLAGAVIGRRIVTAEVRERHSRDTWGRDRTRPGLCLTLDNGTQVWLHDTDDCCAYTELGSFFLDPASYDHVITGVKTADGYTRWFIFAELTDVLKMNVGWSCGNPFYYGYGFDIAVVPLTLDAEVIAEDQKELGS